MLTMKHFFSCFFLIVLALTFSCADVDNNTKPVTTQLFDDDWKFALGHQIDGDKVNFDDSSWRTLTLPHDWSIEAKPEHENPMGMEGGFFPAGEGWYRKTFELNEDYREKQISLYFEGVYMNAEVFVNGKSLGAHPYGYTSFFHDITDYVTIGALNTIAVKVDNSAQTNCRWYSGSGIYRHVWLIAKNPIHLKLWETVITTKTLTENKATVQIASIVTNSGTAEGSITVETQIVDGNGEEVVSKESHVELTKLNEKPFSQEVTIQNPKLWSVQHPELYKAKISVKQDDELIDFKEVSFGIRTLVYNAEEGLLLNGKSILLNGGCVHHDNGCLGAAAFDRAEERKVELLKEAGFNAVRTSHNPPSEAFLAACDRLGLLVIDEAFDGWRTQKTPNDYSKYIDEWWQRDLDAMVKRDRNHPSVIMWSIGNEIIERTEPQAIETGDKFAKYVRSLDSTRPVTSAITTWGQGWARFDSLFAVHDIGGYNYQLHYAEEDHERVPDRIILQTESYPKDAFYVWDQTQKHRYIIGDFVWTAMDYLGESSIGRYYYPGEPDGQHWQGDLWPWHGAYCGDIDLTGWRKPISHYRNILWNADEKIYMAVREPNPDNGTIKLTDWAVWPTWESWNWPGYEGKILEVEVYSKYPSVRLYLNDSLIGEQPTTYTEAYKTLFKVPFKKGIIRAVGVENDKEKQESMLRSAETVSGINLIADREMIKADGQDLVYISVALVDSNGIPQPLASNELHFSIEGEGTIVGIDNASLKDTRSYKSTSCNAWMGKAMVVVRANNKEGTVRLRVSTEGLPEATVTIKTEKVD